jgi:hypothetical protein
MAELVKGTLLTVGVDGPAIEDAIDAWDEPDELLAVGVRIGDSEATGPVVSKLELSTEEGEGIDEATIVDAVDKVLEVLGVLEELVPVVEGLRELDNVSSTGVPVAGKVDNRVVVRPEEMRVIMIVDAAGVLDKVEKLGPFDGFGKDTVKPPLGVTVVIVGDDSEGIGGDGELELAAV